MADSVSMSLGQHRERTRAAYDADAAGWKAHTTPRQLDLAKKLRAEAEGIVIDLGCGPGWHLPLLEPAVGVDLSLEMAQLATEHGAVTQADLSQLPFARESIGGVWASRSLVHLLRTEVPMALAELHRVMRTGATGYLWVFEGDDEARQWTGDPFPGRTFSYWPREMLLQTIEGAGFDVGDFITWDSEMEIGHLMAPITKRWTLPDYVAADMKLLICGLNPSPSSADFGVGFHRAGNRFWPAAIQAGLVTKDRDPTHALAAHGMGMTDMAKRPTRRADELDKAEYQAGFQRLAQLAEWLQPGTICMVGLAGWRAAVNRKAQRGWQPETIGGRPVYLMPSTSGLNAHDTVDTLAEHLRAAAAGR
jgi:TDG/mug DNA glycosylase family protein